MNLSALAFWRQKAAPVNAQPVATASSWWGIIRESFTGAWQRNIEVNRDNVLAYWAVFSCIRQIAGDNAKMRLKLVEEGANDIWSEIKRDSPFLGVLRKPNRHQTRYQFWHHWFCSLLIHGNTYALKVRDGRGMVKALYILDPTRVIVLVGEDGSVWYQLKQDNLSGLTSTGMVTVPADEIIHDRINCLFHQLIGVSPIFACGVAATQGLSIQNNSANFFANGSMPGGILKVPTAITKEKAEALKAGWETGFSGENRGKTAVLGDKIEFEPLSVSAEDAQLIDQLKMTAEMVCSTFGVPGYKVGVGPAPPTASVAAQDQNYYSQTLQPLIEGTENVLDEGLGLVDVPGKTIGVEFDLDALIRMDPAAQMEFAEKGVKSGVLKPNEARARFDLQPVKGGDTPYLQQQNYSLAALDKRDTSEDPFGKAKPEPAPPSLPPPALTDTEEGKQMALDLRETKDQATANSEALAATSRAVQEVGAAVAKLEAATVREVEFSGAEFEAELERLLTVEFTDGR